MPELVTVGRVSVDLYAVEEHVGFEGEQSFTKSVGGSPTNVAVAAARLGRRASVATSVGDDGFGRFVTNKLTEWGVATEFVGVDPERQTPLAFTALLPPETPQVAFYRGDPAPDTQLLPEHLDTAVVQNCGVLWMSQGALAEGSTAESAMQWLAVRNRSGHTILDLDYRPTLWPSIEAARAMATRAIALSTVVVGNLDECEMALGTRDPDGAANALLAAGVQLAIVKLGAEGVLLASTDGRWRVAPIPVDVVSGVGAGDAFGGALVHGLLSNWDPAHIGRFANAAGAIVASRLACAADMPTIAEIEALIRGAADPANPAEAANEKER